MRSGSLAALSLCVLLVTGACVTQPTEVLTAEQASGPRPGGAAIMWMPAVVGDTVKTARGSEVTVHGFDPLVELPDGSEVAAADVEACAGTQASGISPEYFLLEVQNEVLRPPVEVTGRLKDALAAQAIPAGECSRGWVAFELRPRDDPAAVLLAASSFIRWERRVRTAS